MDISTTHDLGATVVVMHNNKPVAATVTKIVVNVTSGPTTTIQYLLTENSNLSLFVDKVYDESNVFADLATLTSNFNDPLGG